MNFTFFKKRTSHCGLRLVMDRDELLHATARPIERETSKDALPLICPASFEGDRRGNARVEAVHMLGLDLDSPSEDPDATVARLASALGDVEVFGYSTFSSEVGAFRLRALIPYDRQATGEEHRGSWALVSRMLSASGIDTDRACKDPARGYYIWAVPPSGAYWTGHVKGAPWPVALAAEVEAERAATEAAERACLTQAARPQAHGSRYSVAERARRYVARMPPALAGAGGHDVTFSVARRLVADFGLPRNEALPILREYNERCVPPWSDRELLHKLESAERARVQVDLRGAR